MRFAFGSDPPSTPPVGQIAARERRGWIWHVSDGLRGQGLTGSTAPHPLGVAPRRGAAVRKFYGSRASGFEGTNPPSASMLQQSWGENWGADWHSQRLRAAERKQAGDDLFKYIVAMYASSKPMSAKDACIISWFAREAGCDGGVCDLAMHPKNATGNFHKHMDTVIPRKEESEYYWMDVPVHIKGVGRTIKRIPMLPLHESLQHESDNTPSLAPNVLKDDDEFQEWINIYKWHPGVRACAPTLPLLCALYADGIRFTRSDRTGKADSLLGFFFICYRSRGGIRSVS